MAICEKTILAASRRCFRNYLRRSRSAAWANPKRSRPWLFSFARTKPGLSLAPIIRLTEDSSISVDEGSRDQGSVDERGAALCISAGVDQMNIDSHQHFWRYDAVRDAWIPEAMAVLQRDFLPEHLVTELTANAMDASVAVQADQSEAETMLLLDFAGKNERIAGVVGWVDLRSPNLAERLEYFSGCPKLRGFRHIAQAEPDDRFLVREDFVRGVAQLRTFGFTYDILVYPKQLPAAIELVTRLPE